MSRLLPVRLFALLALAAFAAPPPGAGQEEPRSGEERAAPAPEVVLLDGRTISGAIEAVTGAQGEGGGLRVRGEEKPIPFYEIQEIRFPSSAPSRAPELDEGPLLRFRGGESLVGRVLEVGEVAGASELARARVEGLGELPVPLEALGAFRLREVHPNDELFERDLGEPPPAEDTVYVRRANLLRVTGTFRGLSEEHLYLERRGEVRRLPRRLVQGVILAPAASRHPESDPPAVLEIRGRGRLPGYITGGRPGSGGPLEALEVRLPGAPAGEGATLPLAWIERITLPSDRVVFLSSLEPARAEAVPVVGTALRYRKDRSVGGGPITLGGRTYRRGLGMRARSALEYSLDGAYRTFAAVIGIDDSIEARGSVTFIVSADGKEVFRKPKNSNDSPEAVSLPVDGVSTLRLEVDFGSDGLDIGDHADWADARVSR